MGVLLTVCGEHWIFVPAISVLKNISSTRFVLGPLFFLDILDYLVSADFDRITKKTFFSSQMTPIFLVSSVCESEETIPVGLLCLHKILFRVLERVVIKFVVVFIDHSMRGSRQENKKVK